MPVAEKLVRGVAVPHLRAWRILRALSQTELAEKAKVVRGTVARAERGEAVSFANIRAFAEVLRVTPEQLQNEEPK